MHSVFCWQFFTSLILVVSAWLPAAAPPVPCLWDDDTIAMERARFPETNELIAGYFVRHSPAYYQWRIDKISKKNQQTWTAMDFDNIAVAYEKLGQHSKAIETIKSKIERFPDKGRYESEANLGTFLIHNGQLEAGLEHIRAAIKINPDAHFGREVFQQYLVEFILAKQTEEVDDKTTFSRFLIERYGVEDDYSRNGQLIFDAIKGVAGMMRFGNYDSPVLLEAMGDLLAQPGPHEDADQVAARAFLRAAELTTDATKKDQLLERAHACLSEHEGIELRDVKRALKSEVAAGEALYQQINSDENGWVAAGLDVDKEFKDKYLKQDRLLEEVNNTGAQTIGVVPVVAWVGGLVLIIGITFFMTRRKLTDVDKHDRTVEGDSVEMPSDTASV